MELMLIRERYGYACSRRVSKADLTEVTDRLPDAQRLQPILVSGIYSVFRLPKQAKRVVVPKQTRTVYGYYPGHTVDIGEGRQAIAFTLQPIAPHTNYVFDVMETLAEDRLGFYRPFVGAGIPLQGIDTLNTYIPFKDVDPEKSVNATAYYGKHILQCDGGVLHNVRRDSYYFSSRGEERIRRAPDAKDKSALASWIRSLFAETYERVAEIKISRKSGNAGRFTYPPGPFGAMAYLANRPPPPSYYGSVMPVAVGDPTRIIIAVNTDHIFWEK